MKLSHCPGHWLHNSDHFFVSHTQRQTVFVQPITSEMGIEDNFFKHFLQRKWKSYNLQIHTAPTVNCQLPFQRSGVQVIFTTIGEPLQLCHLFHVTYESSCTKLGQLAILVILMPRKRPALQRTSSWRPQPSFHMEPKESGSAV